MIKLALTDMDDTLIPFGEPHARASSIEAIHAAQAAGVHFGPVTGRPPCSMKWMFPDNSECCSTGVFSNGQVIEVDGERVRVVGIERELLMRAAQIADELGDIYLAVYSLDDADDAYFVTSERERLQVSPPPTYGMSLYSVVSTLERDFVKANFQCACSHERAEEIRDELVRRIPELDFIFPSQTAKVLDISPHGWTKGSGVLCLAQYLGVEADEIAVFGDSENDLAMIRDIPNSVAVANADPVVAAEARWHIGSCVDGAVDDALLDIAAAASTGSLPRFMTTKG